ncbi:hypothetical protein S245_064220, partial [Arachis hypogaea]
DLIPSFFDSEFANFKFSWKNFTLSELQAATDDFSHDNVIGEGGYAEVYLGKFEDGTFVAIKKLTRGNQEEMTAEFLSKLGIICCISSLLIRSYNLMSSSALSKQNQRSQLRLLQEIQILKIPAGEDPPRIATFSSLTVGFPAPSGTKAIISTAFSSLAPDTKEKRTRHDRSKTVEILVKNLKVFATFNEELFKEITPLLILENF